MNAQYNGSENFGSVYMELTPQPRGITWSSPGVVRGPNGLFIAGSFSNWNITTTVGPDGPWNIGYMIDMILGQANASFSSQNLNMSRLGAVVNGLEKSNDDRFQENVRLTRDLQTLNQQRFNEIAQLRKDLNQWNQERGNDIARTRQDMYALNQQRYDEIAKLNQWNQERGNDIAKTRQDMYALNQQRYDEISKLNQWNIERGQDIARNRAEIEANKNTMMGLNQARFNEIAKLTSDLKVVSDDNIRWNLDRQLEISNLGIVVTKNNTDVNKRIDALALNGGSGGVIELTSLITAITLAAKDNSDLWNAEHYDGGSVGEKDGRAVRLFKVQFQEIKTLISSMFSNYFSLTDANSTASKIKLSIENAPKRTESLLNSMYVTMNNRFNRIIELLESILAKEGGAPGSNGEVLARLDTVISSLDRCIEILIQILNKEIKVDIPDVTVNVPEVTLSESGNGWLRTLIETVGDVMKTAITSMADVLKTAIEELGKSLGKVLDFLDGLMDWVIKLVVPENLDFMESKFDSTSKTIKGKFPFIFDWVDIFKGMFGGQEAIPDIQMSMGSFFGEEKVNLPLSYFNEIAPNVRIFVTGFILLGFLIDMYKWFHTRGEVLE